MDFLKMSDVDVAYYILQQRGKDNTLYYKDLIMDVIEKRQKPVQSLSESISEVYTQINMDSRFRYAKNGNWGLSEWSPEEKKSSSHSRASISHTKQDNDNDNDMKKFEDIQLEE